MLIYVRIHWGNIADWKYGSMSQEDGDEPVKVDWSQNLAEAQIYPLSNGDIEAFLAGMWEEVGMWEEKRIIWIPKW